jgi:mycothiol synthase
MPVEVRPFDPSSASETELAGVYAVMMEVMALDHPDQSQPTLPEYVASLGRPRTALGPVRRWFAWEDGIKADGVGETWARGLGFVRTHGYVRQVLTLADADQALWQHPVAAGFRLESWTGAAPEELLAEYARARTAITDAPNGESALEFEDWTPERVRTHEADLSARGVRNRVTVAVHEDGGEGGGEDGGEGGKVAALTELSVRPEQPSRAFQQDTAVVAGFRGHGLGLAVKGAMLRRLTAEQPGVEQIFTQTAHDNVHMIRINHALGFVTTAALSELEVGVAELAKRLEA